MTSDTTIKYSLPQRHELHGLRKLFHLVGGLLLALGYEIGQFTQREGTMILGSLFAFFLTVETARGYSTQVNRLLIKLWGPFMRQYEVKQRSGMFFFVGGCLFATAFFPRPIAILSILYLSCGDPIASLFGILFKGVDSMRSSNGKSLIGTLIMIMICSLMTYRLLSDAGVVHHVALVALIGGISAGFTEFACPNPVPIDDNFVIPVVSSLALYSTFSYYGINENLVFFGNSI
eukprot:TRINITY_DN21713_c0_g1_i1.p1 TRINITY_DN21713_c0_g1~~TRINITY_DN21713_c0_g1_i1.p1  ORF type:complete len:260 (+),score=29.38 TRINITY_DN21713_c0_g1_i1:84-782(+)